MPETLVSFCAHPEDVATIALLAALCMLATAGLPAEAAGRADSAGRGAGLAATPANDAGNFKVIHAFRGEDGAVPDAGLIQASDGNFYGTTALGVRVGTVFRMTADGQVTVLHAFDGVDGRYPTAALVQGADGFLYGTTSRGGPWGWGTIFRISTSGDFTQLYAFTGYSDGAQPDAPLIQASDGNFYGTTVYGGIGTGNVFRMTPDGTVTDVHSFDRDAEHGFSGAYPEGGLLQASDGLLYGLVSGSGSAVDCKLRGGCGGIYRLALDGSSFAGISLAYWQGAGPWGELIEGTDGQLYGVAIQGGNRQACRRGCGTVFQVTREMKVTPIHFFNGVDGQFPRAALLQASDGNLYGTTEFGGSSFACSDCGIVFRIMSDGRFELLRALRGSNEGKNPQGKLLQATDGSLYGTAPDGGFGGEGTAFRLTQRWRRQRGDLLMS